METFRAIIDWFSGGSNQYMTLYHCMAHDTLWVVITVLLDFAVAAGYVLIAWHWWQNQKNLQNDEARIALGRMRNIFVFCGICGYLFIPIKMVWPAWRLYDIFMVVLVYYTWAYAWGAHDLKVIYRELGRSARLSSELEQAREQARRKRFFLNALSHDLKNPLYALGLQAELATINLEKGNQEQTEASLSHIRDCAAEAGRLLEDFLEIGRLEWEENTMNSESFDLSQLLMEVVDSHSPTAEEKGLQLNLVAPPGLQVTSDRVKAYRVASNLVINALKYTEQGSVNIEARGDATGVEFQVADTGPGIAEEHLGRLFDEFYQVRNPERNPTKGFGLGLAIAHKLIEQLGGAIDVESTVDQGTTFIVQLPNLKTANREAAPQAQADTDSKA